MIPWDSLSRRHEKQLRGLQIMLERARDQLNHGQMSDEYYLQLMRIARDIVMAEGECNRLE
jgi:hypothetical protein